MKRASATALVLACLTPGILLAQLTPAPALAQSAWFNLDTPIEVLVADERARAVLDTYLPGMTTHPSYEMYKTMSLRVVQPYSNGALTDEMLQGVEAALAELR